MSDDYGDFGDFDPEDAIDHEPADPEQVGRRLHLLIEYLEHEAGIEMPDYDHLSVMQKIRLLHTGDEIVQWLATHADDHEQLAIDVHNFRRAHDNDDEMLPEWDDLTVDQKAVAIGLMAAIVTWLQRQGALS